jgi:hypothetical protein
MDPVDARSPPCEVAGIIGRGGAIPIVHWLCLDETSRQLIAETRLPIPMKAGRPARFDYEYERNGTANLFMMFTPLESWRHVTSRSPIATSRALHPKQAGSICQSPSSASYRPCASAAASPTNTLIDEIAAWQHDRNSRHTRAPTGTSSFDRRALLKKRATDLCNRLQHPNLGFQESWKPMWTLCSGVPIGSRSPRKGGPFACRFTRRCGC